MIRQLSADGLKFRTPKFTEHLQSYSEVSRQYKKIEFMVTDESFIQLENPKIGVIFSGVEVDVFGYVNGIPFVIYITYKGRSVPVKLEHPEKDRSGVVEVGLERLAHAFKQEKEGRYIDVLKTYIEESIDGKSWVYHPRTKKARIQAEVKIAEWLLQQRPPREHPRKAIQAPSENILPYAVPERLNPVFSSEKIAQNYECIVCHAQWHGSSLRCKKCNTHLYTRRKQT